MQLIVSTRQGMMRLLNVRSECLLAHATGVEVFSRELRKAILFQRLATYSPNPRSHEVQRISALRDRF